MYRFHSFPDVDSWCDLPPVHPSSFRGSLFGYLLDSDPILNLLGAREALRPAQSRCAIPIRVPQPFERHRLSPYPHHHDPKY
jgi:hypothetical protein